MRQWRHNDRREGFELTITLLRSEIEYDVDFETWKVADVSQLRGKDAKANVTSEETGDWMFRQVENALAEVRGALLAFSPRVESRAVTDEVPDDREWVINLIMEPGWRGDARTLSSHIHRFVSDSVLYAWYRMTDPQRAVIYASQMDDDKSALVNEARETQVDNVNFMI